MKKPVALAAALLAGASSAASADALIDAVRAGNSQDTVRLIEGGADVNAADSLGTTPLMWAARYGDVVVVERLIEAGAKPAAENVFGVTPMSEAALIGSETVIRELLAAGVDPDSPNPEGETALMLVVRTGQIDAAEALIDAGADVNAKERWAGQTALMWAGAQLQPEMVKLLLANGAEVDARSTVREWTRKVSSEPRPKELPQGGLTPLMFAARTGCIECAELLLGAGADINLADPYGVTPLIVATLNLQNDFAAYLVEKGADFTQWDLYGRTPLYVAIDMMDYPPPRGRDSAEPMSGLQLAEFLLERGANPNSQLKQWRPPFVRLARGQDNTLATGATPLLRAAHASDVAAVKLLLEHKALVDLPNASGITPLMAAAGVGVSQNTSRAKKKNDAQRLNSVFRIVRVYTMYIPLYGSLWSMAVCSDKLDPKSFTADEIDRRVEQRKLQELRFYNGETHEGVFALPNYVRELVVPARLKQPARGRRLGVVRAAAK